MKMHHELASKIRDLEKRNSELEIICEEMTACLKIIKKGIEIDPDNVAWSIIEPMIEDLIKRNRRK